jgi:hypothetical protein
MIPVVARRRAIDDVRMTLPSLFRARPKAVKHVNHQRDDESDDAGALRALSQRLTASSLPFLVVVVVFVVGVEMDACDATT